ncbi:hypothetical protein ACOWML_01005 [Helicobacter pylori]
MYNTKVFIMLSFHLLRTDLPHIATMGRDETLQQTRFKALKRNHP